MRPYKAEWKRYWHSSSFAERLDISLTEITFYERLVYTYEFWLRARHLKIMLWDLNARVGKEGIFISTMTKFRLHDETSPQMY